MPAGNDLEKRVVSPFGCKANIITATLPNGTVFTVKDRWGATERSLEWLHKNPDVTLRFYTDRLRTKEIKERK